MESFECICKFGGWLFGEKSGSIILIPRITSCHVFMIGPMWKLFCSCELPARHVSCCKYSKFCSLYRRAPRCLCFWLFSVLETFRFEDENEIWLNVFSRILKIDITKSFHFHFFPPEKLTRFLWSPLTIAKGWVPRVIFATLETRCKLGRVKTRKDFWDSYRRQRKEIGQ